MNCPRCGAQMAPDSSFCGVCGNRIDAGSPTSGSQAGERIHIDEDSRGQGRGYSYEVLHQPAFSLAVVQLHLNNRSRQRPAQWYRCLQTLNYSRR